MEILATVFDGRGSQRGFKFEQVKREGKVALYSKYGGQTHYEVIIIQDQKGGDTNMGGKIITFAEKERFPSDEEFGTYGWTYNSLEKAMKKFHSVLEEIELKKTHA